MGWLRRRKERGSLDRPAVSADRKHLEEFVATRRGVEVFVEPRTTVTESTVVLVAHDGEWTRRRVPSSETAYAWAHAKGLPCYDVTLVGYPQRMRDWNSRRGRGGRGLVD